jgi:hypothetical protein
MRSSIDRRRPLVGFAALASFATSVAGRYERSFGRRDREGGAGNSRQRHPGRVGNWYKNACSPRGDELADRAMTET